MIILRLVFDHMKQVMKSELGKKIEYNIKEVQKPKAIKKPVWSPGSINSLGKFNCQK